MQCKVDVICYTLDDFCDNYYQSCLWLFNDSLKCTCKYCVDGSICHLKFSKIMRAHILGEVGIYIYTVSGKKVNPWTILNRNVKAPGSLTKLCALYFEYTYERTTKIRRKILFNRGVIILQISMMKNLSFQHNFS